MARKIIAGNWKMNLNLQEGITLIKDIAEYCSGMENLPVEVVVSPPFIHLSEAVNNSRNKLIVAAQNCSEHKSGAYTGEVSVDMLQSIGVKTVIIGHSERREYYGETDALVNAKLKALQQAKSEAIVCIGEKLEDRKSGNHKAVVQVQLEGALEGLSSADLQNLILAYEPVWAIGTGETASPEQAQEMHAFIRNFLLEKFGKEVAQSTSILYGGSVKPSNAQELFGQPDVDGGLIGGASLKTEDFSALIKIGAEVL